MKKMIAIALSLFLVIALAVYGLAYCEHYKWNAENVPACFAASDSGVYLLHPNHRPKRILRWRSENHALLQDGDLWYGLDGDTLYCFSMAAPEPVQLRTGIDLDWELGADAIAVSGEEVWYLPPEEPHWRTLPGLDGAEVHLRTLVHLLPNGAVYTDIPVTADAQPVLKYSYGHLYSVATDREGRVAMVVNSDLSSRLKSEWVARDGDRVYLNAYNLMRLAGVQADGTLRLRELTGRDGRELVHDGIHLTDQPIPLEGYTFLYDKERLAMLLYRDRHGSLRVLEDRSDQSYVVDFMSFFAPDVIESARYQDNCLTLTDGDTTWAYVRAVSRYAEVRWKCYRLP